MSIIPIEEKHAFKSPYIVNLKEDFYGEESDEASFCKDLPQQKIVGDLNLAGVKDTTMVKPAP